MNYSIKVNTTAHNVVYTLEEPDIQWKDDYSCIKYWEENVINLGTNAERFWRFYYIAFKLAYQSNAITRQAFTLLVSTVTKKEPAKTDEEYIKRIALWLIESIRYKYEPSERIEETAQLIKEVTRRTSGFAEGSTLHAVLSQLKKKLDPDRESKRTFISFLGKLVKKEKGYTTVSKPERVDHPDWTFKVINDTASILTDNLEEESSTSSILENLDLPEELERITWVTRIYNLRSHSISLTVTRKKLVVLTTRKHRKSILPGLLTPPAPLVNPILNNTGMALLAPVVGNVFQTQINTLV